MKRGQVFVRAEKKDGSFDSVDVLDLDDASFRAFVMDILVREALVVGILDEVVEGSPLRYKEKS